MGAASGGALVTGVNAVTRGNEIIVRPEQLLQFRMNQAALVPITLKDGHQVAPGPGTRSVATRRAGSGTNYTERTCISSTSVKRYTITICVQVSRFSRLLNTN